MYRSDTGGPGCLGVSVPGKTLMDTLAFASRITMIEQQQTPNSSFNNIYTLHQVSSANGLLVERRTLAGYREFCPSNHVRSRDFLGYHGLLHSVRSCHGPHRHFHRQKGGERVSHSDSRTCARVYCLAAGVSSTKGRSVALAGDVGGKADRF